jgi:hypothetical protein
LPAAPAANCRAGRAAACHRLRSRDPSNNQQYKLSEEHHPGCSSQLKMKEVGVRHSVHLMWASADINCSAAVSGVDAIMPSCSNCFHMEDSTACDACSC